MRSLRLGSSVVARLLLAVSGVVCCATAPAATVVLRDGTVIQGEVKSLQDGVYTIESASVGTLHVRAEDVRSIDAQGAQQPASAPEVSQSAAGPAGVGGALDAVKSQIGADPKLLAAVLGLQNDPEVLALLADPEVAKAIAASDYNALMSNPKITALMANPKVREIIDALR